MSAFLDAQTGDSYYTDSLVGPQTNGTNYLASSSLTAQPSDTGGGAPFNYGAAVLDVFKVGVGAWTQTEQQKNLLDYKRFETTAAGTFQQGRGVLLSTNANGGISLTTVLIVGALLFVLLSHKG